MILSIVIAVSDSFDTTNKLSVELNTTLKNIFSFSKNKNVNLEIILVNWNMNSKKKTLKKIDLTTKPDSVTLHYIEVNHKIHSSFTLSNKIPFYIGQATNIGLRRAKAKAILTMKAGVFFSKDSWKYILEHIKSDSYKKTFLTLVSKAKVNKKILTKENDIYSLSSSTLKKYYRWELKRQELIDYDKHRIYLRREQYFRLFDSFLFSKKQARNICGFPELSIYPGIMIEKIFIENMIKNHPKNIMLSASCKVDYNEKTYLNPSDDLELRLAPNTKEIILARILKEKNPIIFNSKNWGLKNSNLKQICL